jgi:hypothetical protein
MRRRVLRGGVVARNAVRRALRVWRGGGATAPRKQAPDAGNLAREPLDAV